MWVKICGTFFTKQEKKNQQTKKESALGQPSQLLDAPERTSQITRDFTNNDYFTRTKHYARPFSGMFQQVLFSRNM